MDYRICWVRGRGGLRRSRALPFLRRLRGRRRGRRSGPGRVTPEAAGVPAAFQSGMYSHPAAWPPGAPPGVRQASISSGVLSLFTMVIMTVGTVFRRPAG